MNPQCPGIGQLPTQMVCQPDPGVRDLRNGRGVCPSCHRTLALNSAGRMRGHKAEPVYLRGVQ